MTPTRLSTKEDYKTLLDKYDTWMFDCDGVLWNGDRLVDGAVKVLEILRTHKKSVLFVTNNATKARPSYKKKFDKLGVEAHVDEIFGSAYAAAVYISSVMKLPKDKKVYVVGMEGVEQELAAEGISYIGGTDPADQTLNSFSLSSFTRDPAVSVVLCGLDTAINYTKLAKAFQYLQDPSVTFLVTNDDSTYPSEGGLLPGAGAVSAPLKTASGREPLSIGKPASTMLDCIKAKHDFDPKRTIMVGDRLNTDILFGQNGGLSTLLVLTGESIQTRARITHVEDIEGPNASSIIPEYVTNSIGDLRVLA
ncbi:2-phosphoglycolate phosphatase [Heliocybe sulcata]|uniref:4-nitrophenylphosphatase n=1 Tax=Heliocybe sulcata TaxID=5364 RepID=A0A5C3NA54_9AGAM|nr:2-phosphoglycolate phosphatase [Heliocybe sulcata]